MARKATGSKEWRVRLKTWVGRVRGEDGLRSRWHDLCTNDPDMAEERLQQWLKTGAPPSVSGKELFSVAAERVIDKQEARGEKQAGERRHRIRAFALPVIGHLEVAALEPHNIYSVLSRMGEQEQSTRAKYAADTVHHLRVDISRILTELVREGVLKTNIARDVELPDDVEVDDRPRVVLTDEEVMRFRRRGFETELDMMALVARDLGGHRTSDLHAADWSDYDTVTWATAHVRRPKTDREGSRKGRRKGRRRATRGYERLTITIPESVVGPLRTWWQGQGSPKDGPVFPLRRGPKAGQRKSGRGISYAQALREALWEEAIVRPLPGYESAVGDARRDFCALQVDTDSTRAVDFHSFRRAYVTALANAGVNAQTAMALSGHADMATHQRYISHEVMTVPAAALPGSSLEVVVTDVTPTGDRVTSVTGGDPSAPMPAPAVWTNERLGQEPASTPPAALGGVRLTGIDAAQPGLTEVLTALLGVLRGGTPALGLDRALIDPGLGSNDLEWADSKVQNPEGFHSAPERIRTFDIRLRRSSCSTQPEETTHTSEHALPLLEGPSEPGLTQVAGQSQPALPTSSSSGHWNLNPSLGDRNEQKPPKPGGAPAPETTGSDRVSRVAVTLLEQLQASAQTALDERNWSALRALEPVIEAEVARLAELARGAPPAPVRLEVVRAQRKGAPS